MPRPPSDADERLAGRLRKAGLDADGRRVQKLVTVGLIAPAEPIFSGGGGSGGVHSDESVDQAKEAIELDDKYPWARYLAVVEMFGRGHFQVAEAKLKRAMLKMLDREERAIRSASPTGAGAAETASLAGPVLARSVTANSDTRDYRRRLKRGQDARIERLALAMSDLAMIFLAGEVLSPLDMGNLFELSGASQVNRAFQPGDPALDPADFAELFEAMTFNARRETVERSDRQDLEQKRSDYSTIERTVRISVDLIPRLGGPDPLVQLGKLEATGGLGVGMAALQLLTWSKHFPEQYETRVASLKEFEAFLDALAVLAGRLDPRFHPMVFGESSAGIEVEQEYEAELQRVLPKFVRECPDEARILKYTYGSR